MVSRDKHAVIAEVTQAPDMMPEQLTYKDLVTRKIEEELANRYEWLEDFSIAIVDIDNEGDFAYGVGRLNGYSGGFSVEFPIFYFKGKLQEVTSFFMPERGLIVPFTEAYYNLIKNNLNNTDNIAMVREKDEMSDAARELLESDKAMTTSDLIKLSSFTRILASMPRRVVRQFAKTASANFPELTRDFYSALKLSQMRDNVKRAAAARVDHYLSQDKKKKNLEKEVMDAAPMKTIVTPVFRSEAEMKETDSKIKGITEVDEGVYIVEDYNSMVNVTGIPDTSDMVKALNEEFEIVSAKETADLINLHMEEDKVSPVLIICPSTGVDYWVLPDIQKRASLKLPNTLLLSKDTAEEISPETRRLIAVNEMGGEHYFDFALLGTPPETIRKQRVIYTPGKLYKQEYFCDILDTPLSLDTILSIVEGSSRILPVKSQETGRVFRLNILMRGNSDRNKRTQIDTKDGNLIYKVYTTDEVNNTERVAYRIVADALTKVAKKIFIYAEYMHYSAKESIQRLLDNPYEITGNQYIGFDLEGLTSYSPDRYILDGNKSSLDGDFISLKPIGEDDRPIFIYNPDTASFAGSSGNVNMLLSHMFDNNNLDPDFVLNDLRLEGPETDADGLNIPFMEVELTAEGCPRINIKNKCCDGATDTKVYVVPYDGIKEAVSSLAGMGIVLEDLISLKEDLESHRSDKIAYGVPYDAVVTKLSYAVTPTVEAEAEGLTSEDILLQMGELLSRLQEDQQRIQDHMESRDKLLDTQLELLDTKVDSIDELHAKLDELLEVSQEPMMEPGMEGEMMEPGMDPEMGGSPEEMTIPPEVLQAMAEAVVDPDQFAESLGLQEQDIIALQEAAQGDEASAQEIGLDPQSHQMFMQFVEELMQNEGGMMEEPYPEEMEGEGLTEEDVDAIIMMLVDPEGAIEQGIPEDAIELVHAAAEGDEEAMAEMGITPEEMEEIIAMAEQAMEEGGMGEEGMEGGGPSLSEEELMEIAQIVGNPEAAMEEGIPEEAIQMLMAAMEGDEQAMNELGLTPGDIEVIMHMRGDSMAAPEEEAPMGFDYGNTEEQLLNDYENAKRLVTAYLNPARAGELEVTPEDLGMVTMALRSRDYAEQQGIQRSLIMAIGDAYTAITGRPIYMSAEKEFDMVPGEAGMPATTATKNVISNSKEFEEYTKPLAETSALLDMLPSIKTTKLFFKNSEEFRSMMKVLGEILMNLQINAVQYQDVMGASAYERLLHRVKKVYDDFGTLVLEMYTLDGSTK